MRKSLAVHTSSKSAEHYTPPAIVKAVVQVFGVIDLDPCADPGKLIPALRHYTKQDDGLSQFWNASIYMNLQFSGDSCILTPCNFFNVGNAKTISLSPPSTSHPIPVIVMDSSPIAKTVTEICPGCEWLEGGRIRMSVQEYLRRRLDTPNLTKDAPPSDDNQKQLITSGDNETLILPGNGHQMIGRLASELGTIDVPTAGREKSLPKTTLYQSAMPYALEPLGQISSQPATGAIAQNNTNHPLNGAKAPKFSKESLTTSEHCPNFVKVIYPSKVYVNPPYGLLIGPWIAKLREELWAGRVSEAIALVPARTDTEWWERLTDEPSPTVCFVRAAYALAMLRIRHRSPAQSPTLG